MQPTILVNIQPGNPAFREEFFGPVALVFRVKSGGEAVALANDSDFGLGGSVFPKDVARGMRVASFGFELFSGLLSASLRAILELLSPRTGSNAATRKVA